MPDITKPNCIGWNTSTQKFLILEQDNFATRRVKSIPTAIGLMSPSIFKVTNDFHKNWKFICIYFSRKEKVTKICWRWKKPSTIRTRTVWYRFWMWEAFRASIPLDDPVVYTVTLISSIFQTKALKCPFFHSSWNE